MGVSTFSGLVKGTTILIYRISNVYLSYIYRISNVFGKGESRQIQNKNNKKEEYCLHI